MTRLSITRNQRRRLASENESWPDHLQFWPRNEWPPVGGMSNPPFECWRSRNFLVQIFREANDVERLSICRSCVVGDRFADGISWDDLQRLKHECGRGHKYAVEIYPADHDVVNVANMRHLWILSEPPPFAWRGVRKMAVAA